jgi:hypothetical protein
VSVATLMSICLRLYRTVVCYTAYHHAVRVASQLSMDEPLDSQERTCMYPYISRNLPR